MKPGSMGPACTEWAAGEPVRGGPAPPKYLTGRPLSEPGATVCQILGGDDRRPGHDQIAHFLADRRNCEWAKANELASIVARRAADRLGWDLVGEPWRAEHAAVARRIGAYLAELDRLAGCLAGAGIPLIALKNGGIARGIYPDPGACPMGDLDVLVQRAHFRRAHRILLDEGYRFEFRSAREKADLAVAEASGGAEYWRPLPGGEDLWLELQWRPVAGRWIRPDQEPGADELMPRSIAIPGTAARLLAPEDNLLQVALHTAKHSYVRAPGFRLHLDVERIVRAYPDLDWARFLERTTRLGVMTAVYFSLAIPHATLGTPVPAVVLDALCPAGWKRAWLARRIEQAGLFEPGERKFGRLAYLSFSALLYDDARGLWQGIFPARPWMRRRYGLRSDWLLPWYYARRLVDLGLRRERT